MHISYCILASPLGRLLVAHTDHGLCAVSLGDDDSLLEADLRRRYAQATLSRATSSNPMADDILAYLAGAAIAWNFALDVQGTPFQREVWQALQAIPYGQTRSYSQIAQAIGRPKAVRAVGRACAINPVSLVVPCHRAVGSDGRLHGFYWGVERKQALLEMERQDRAVSRL